MLLHFVLERAAALYGFSPEQLSPLSGGHFSLVYEFSRANRSFILRITPPNDEIDISAMRAVLGWVEYLSLNGASVPTPLHSRDGHLIEIIQSENGTYLLVAFEKLVGTLAEDLFPDRWSDRLTDATAFAVGRMHAVSRSYHPDRKILRPAWDKIVNCFNPLETLDDDYKWVEKKRREIMALIHSLPLDEDGYGLIHTDLHLANIMVEDSPQSVAIIDFDDCSYGWYVMDVAMLLLDLAVLYIAPGIEAYLEDFLRRFLKTYREQYPLDLYWIRMLPHFLKLLEIGLYIMLYREYDPGDRGSWVGRFMTGREDRIRDDLPYLAIDFEKLSEEIAA